MKSSKIKTAIIVNNIKAVDKVFVSIDKNRTVVIKLKNNLL